MPQQIDLARESDFRLGPLLVRPSVREVIHPDGRRELLEPRVMQVLVVLAQAGGTVSRDRLIELCWSGRIVGDDAINRVIGRLRRLGESVGEPAFEIETVTKVGFRLAVHEASLEAAISHPTPAPDRHVLSAQSQSVPLKPEPSGARPDRRGLLLAAGGGALIVGAGAAGIYIWRRGAIEAAPRIAVMPFANLSGDPDQAYFSDGLAEDLRGALARLPKVTVVGRTSSEKLRNDDAVAVGKALNVSHILTGSVRRSASLIRVTVQLVDGANGVERWSQSYDRAPGDTLTIQSDVAQRVAQALSITLGLLDKAALVAGGTANAGAHDLYLRAAEIFFRSGTKEDTQKALELCDGALTLDPTYADAHVLRANAILNLTVWFKDISWRSQGGLHEAELASRRAIAFAPQLAMGRAMLGRALYEQLKPRAAMAENEKGRNLPGNGRMMRFYGIFLSRIGHAKEALATFAAGTLDPLDSDSWVDQAWVYSNVGRYEDSIVAAKKSLELAPHGQVYGWQFYGDSLIALGKMREGLAVLAHMPPDTPQRLSAEITAYQKLGDQAAADHKMAELRRISGGTVDEVFARFYARQGKFEPALQALERAWAARDPWLIDLPIEDALKPLHDEPRFKAIWNAIDFP